MRNAALGVLHFFGDFPAQADQRRRMFVLPFGVALAAGARTTANIAARAALAARDMRVEVGVRDASRRAAAKYRLQLDAEVPGALTHRRRRQRLFARRARRAGRILAGG